MPKSTKAKHPGGRPTLFTQELADEICAELAQGKSLRTVLGTGAKDKDGNPLDTPEQLARPSISTVFNWFRTQPKFLEQYTRAKEESSDAMADEILDIADDGRNDWMTINGKRATNREVVDRSKLRVDTRKWLMAKMKPKRYGDKLDVKAEVDGKLNIKLVDFKNADDNNTAQSES